MRTLCIEIKIIYYSQSLLGYDTISFNVRVGGFSAILCKSFQAQSNWMGTVGNHPFWGLYRDVQQVCSHDEILSVWWLALGRVLVVPNLSHLTIMEAIGVLVQSSVFCRPCVYLSIILPLSDAFSFFKLMVFVLIEYDLSVVRSSIKRCVPFQTMPNQFNFTQVDSSYQG